MKKLTLPTPTVFLMVGVPGAGKSYFARQFAAGFGLPYVSADRIRFELFNEPEYSPSEQAIVNRMADYVTDELLSSGSTFIVDGTFANAKTARMNLARRARAKGYSVISVWVQVDNFSARDRSMRRKPGKRDDQFNSPLSAENFAAISKQLSPPTTEIHIVISGKHTYAAQKSAVLKRLQAIYDDHDSATTQKPATSTHPVSGQSAGKNSINIKDTDTATPAQKTPEQKRVILPSPPRNIDKPNDRPPHNHRIAIS